MMGRSHLIISTGVTLSTISYYNGQISMPVIVVAAISSLVVDVDEPNALLLSKAIPSKVLKLIRIVSLMAVVFISFLVPLPIFYKILLAVPVGSISFVSTRTLRKLFLFTIGCMLIIFGYSYSPWNYILGSILIILPFLPHRGITHTVYGLIGWTLILFFAAYKYDHMIWIAGGLSYLVHLLCDCLTDRGIQPLPPFKFRIRLRLMSTGTFQGTIIESVAIGLTIILVWVSIISPIY